MSESATHGCTGNPCTICGLGSTSGCTCSWKWPCPLHTTVQYNTYPYPTLNPTPVSYPLRLTTDPKLSDEDVERIARKLAEILKEDK